MLYTINRSFWQNCQAAATLTVRFACAKKKLCNVLHASELRNVNCFELLHCGQLVRYTVALLMCFESSQFVYNTALHERRRGLEEKPGSVFMFSFHVSEFPSLTKPCAKLPAFRGNSSQRQEEPHMQLWYRSSYCRLQGEVSLIEAEFWNCLVNSTNFLLQKHSIHLSKPILICIAGHLSWLSRLPGSIKYTVWHRPLTCKLHWAVV